MSNHKRGWSVAAVARPDLANWEAQCPELLLSNELFLQPLPAFPIAAQPSGELPIARRAWTTDATAHIRTFRAQSAMFEDKTMVNVPVEAENAARTCH